MTVSRITFARESVIISTVLLSFKLHVARLTAVLLNVMAPAREPTQRDYKVFHTSRLLRSYSPHFILFLTYKWAH